jgi:EmrB/QacA subfamily drug resistance transporter
VAKSTRTLVTAGLMIGMMLSAVDQTIAATALPTIVGDLGGLERMSWVTTAYMLASVPTVPITGKLVDLFGRRRWYLIGVLLFLAGSAASGLAGNMTQLICFRVLQGLGGGMIMPITHTIIGDLYPGPARAKMQGLFASAYGLASVLGPKLGGTIVEAWDWRWVFFINLPIGLAAAALVAAGLKEAVVRGVRRIDYGGATAVAAGTVCLLVGLDRAGTVAWTDPLAITMFGVALALLTLFVVLEARAEEPILPLQFFRNSIFTVGGIVSLLMSAGFFGAIVFVPLFLQAVVGTGPSEAGTALTPMILGMVVASAVCGRSLLHVSYRVQLGLGLLVAAVGFFLLSTLTVDATRSQVILFTFITGVGCGLGIPTVTIAVQNELPASNRGVATASVHFFRAVGSAVGTSLFGAILNMQAARLVPMRLAPVLAGETANPSVASLRHLVEVAPQQAFQWLLGRGATGTSPAALSEPVARALASALAGSLQIVFLWACAFAATAGLSTLFMSGARLVARRNEEGEDSA